MSIFIILTSRAATTDALNIIFYRLDLIWESGRSDIQYAQWSPTGHALLWVVENNLYFKPNLLASEIGMETNGGKNAIFNGIPDWVYEGEKQCLISLVCYFKSNKEKKFWKH